MNDIQRHLVDQMYDHVLRSANNALRSSKLFPIEILKLENPSYTQISSQLKELCDVIGKLVFDDPEMKIEKAREYVEHLRQIAKAIENEDEESLKHHVDQLDRRPFL